MNFAILGDDPAILPFVQTILQAPGHAVTHAVVGNENVAKQLMVAFPSLQVVTSWEELLGVTEMDAIIVSGHADSTLQGAKQLVAVGKSLLIFPDICQDSAWIYEMSLVRDDSQAVMIPVFPLRENSHVRSLQAFLAEGRIGKMLHLQFDREIQVQSAKDVALLLTVDSLNQSLLDDVDLVRTIGGEYNRITALHSGKVDEQVALATVTLSGTEVPEVTWSARPVASESRWTLRVVGENDEFTLSSTAEASPKLSLQGPGVEESTIPKSNSWNSLLEHFVEGKERVTWTDLTRDFELVEATARSLRRRRSIDLHFETTSERSQFKTQMTAIGCGMISMTLVSVIFLLVINWMFDLNPVVMKIARIGVFAPLAIFLILQFLLFISRPSAPIAGTTPESDQNQAEESLPK